MPKQPRAFLYESVPDYELTQFQLTKGCLSKCCGDNHGTQAKNNASAKAYSFSRS